MADPVRAESPATVESLHTMGLEVAMLTGDSAAVAAAIAADVGIAIGGGTDIAIEAGDVVLMHSDLAGVVNAIALARRTLSTIRTNFFWAYGYNVVLIPLAAGVLFPFTGWLLNPMVAAGAMSVSSLFVLTNALRLKRFKPALAASRAPTQAPGHPCRHPTDGSNRGLPDRITG